MRSYLVIIENHGKKYKIPIDVIIYDTDMASTIMNKIAKKANTEMEQQSFYSELSGECPIIEVYKL